MIMNNTTNENDTSNENEEKAINEIVERYLKNEHVNSTFIPDFIEKRLYRNMLKLVTGILKDTIKNTNVEVLGHKITLSMTPIENSKDESTILSHEITEQFIT